MPKNSKINFLRRDEARRGAARCERSSSGRPRLTRNDRERRLLLDRARRLAP
ncbi:hypothetical protein [Jiangella rhizosphaerae]|uniref:hypothetical protein n=1 Tax=Jiangella rhizosphaerae TaxID=2293569 RepID=UPI001F2E7570|nr:hypothetical protein [Jiangella rhizosphaerae]